jgi:hypothetical protein
MKVGSLVNHKNYFGVGIVIAMRELRGERLYKVHWLREGKNFGWANIDRDLRQSVEVLCK